MTDPTPSAPPVASRSAGAVAGVLGAATALATGELLSGLLDVTPSPVLAVGGRFVDEFAASLKEVAVAWFGTNDKAALVTGTVVISLVLGALVGVAARRRPWAAPAVLGGFALFGAWAQLQDPRGLGAVVWLIAAASAAAGTGAIVLLLAAATAPSDEGAAPATVDRRRFLGLAGAFAVVTAGAAAFGRSLQQHDVVASAAKRFKLRAPGRTTPVPDAQPISVEGISSYVTSTDDFYRIDTALSVPQVDAASWRLRVEGMVDDPFEMTYEDLLALPSVEEVVTLQCVSNEVGGDLVGNARWQGVPLTDLLERAGVQDGADQIFMRSVDGWTCGFPTELAGDGRVALVAYAMNGEPLPAAHGFPARLVVSGLYGYVSATKWIESIELTTWDGADGYWVPRGWAKEGPIKLMSRIDVPRSGAKVAAGTVAFGGVAWLPNTGISKVEVQVDDGEWTEADLGRVASVDTWVQWRAEVSLAAGDHRARVRAIDADGRVQTAEVAEPAPDGATGLDEVRFTVEGS
ncbi:MAG TPA: molybdopterin-dependent oxidoreductase [Aquihabitans sp.]|nr:molybdopterin-dependent oxidoreductase [Aquihabitans sp.]